MELPPSEPEISSAKSRWFLIGAAWVGPLLCWLPLLANLISKHFISQLLPDHWLVRVASGFFLLAYFPVSALICGFSTSYFLNRAHPQREIAEGVALLHQVEKDTLHAGCWTQNLLLVPFLLHPAMWCLMPILAPLHAWLYGIAFARGVKFWDSERPRQWIGDFNAED